MSAILVTDDAIDLAADSRAREVIVYTDRAEVKRTMTVMLTAGENTVSFRNLGAGIDEDSIKAAVDRAGMHVSAVFLEQNQLYFFRKAEHEKLYRDILDCLADCACVLDEKSLCALENRMITELREYIRQSLNHILLQQDVALVKLNEALQFLDSQTSLNHDRIIEKNDRYRHLTEKLNLLRLQLEAVRKLDARQQNNVLVSILSDSTGEAEIGIRYTLSTAAWRTTYDAELDREKSAVRISYYGEILQNSGEDWSDVKLILSTAACERSIDLPEIYPVYLSGFRKKREKNIVQEDRIIKEELPGDEGDYEPGATSETETGAQSPGAVKSATGGTAYTFEVLRPATIPPDNNWHKVLIEQQEIPARVSYETAPEIMEYVYLRAAFSNTLGLPLLPGSLAVYRNKSYVGRSVMKYTAPDGPISLSFGIDNDLRVKRIEYENSRKPANLLSNRIVWGKETRFILYNYKQHPEKVLVKEGIFISEIKDVVVEVQEGTSPGYTLDKEGVVQWTVDLPPDPFRHTELALLYTVSAPKSFHLDL